MPATAAAGGKTRGITCRDVTSPGQGKYRDVITAPVDIRLCRTAGRNFLQQTTSPHDAADALPRDARRPITDVALPSRDLIPGRHVCCYDVTDRRQSNAGECYL